jgi:hypothetical protein
MYAIVGQMIPVVSGLCGLWLGSRLNFSVAHRTWVLDNKKLEWRELIDAVGEALRGMDAIDHGADPPSRSVQRVFIVLNNRIFIAKTVAREKLIDRWDQINRDFNRELRSPNIDDKAILDSQRARQAFPSVLIGLSRTDLRIQSAK